MSNEINEYYTNAQLAQASYAIFDAGMTPIKIEDALKNEQGDNTYSATQSRRKPRLDLQSQNTNE